MRKLWFVLNCIVVYLLALPVYAGQAQVGGLRFWTDPENTRLVFDVSEKPVYRVQTAKNPYRLIIDMHNMALSKALVQPPSKHPLLAGVQSTVHNGSDLHIEVGLKAPTKPNSFTLPPNQIYGNRLVIDLSAENSPVSKGAATTTERKPSAQREAPTAASKSTHVASAAVSKQAARQAGKPSAKQTSTSASVATGARPKDIIVAIDAGHGGEDPGAHGKSGVNEKVLVFAIAQKLEKLMKNYPGIRPVMIRNGDYYVGLRKRIDIARNSKADLFVSIHADAYKDSNVKGASVFTLSQHGASSEAAHWLADSENAADLVGGVSLEDKDDVLASVLLDLSQTATQEASQRVAKRVLRSFSKISTLHHDAVQKAGFVVLKSPDIPSILVETAFISNPSDEENLRSEQYQKKVAQAIFNGVLDYFQQNPPAGTRMASNDNGTEG